jgi:hypothetical protein
MEIKPNSSKSSALKVVTGTPRTKTGKTPDEKAIIRAFLNKISIYLESCPKEGKSELENNPFAWSASQVNTDLALTALCEAEGDIGIEDDNYWDFCWSSEYQKLQETFKAEVEDGDTFALLNMVWRAYNAGRLSPERLEPDSAHVRVERHRRRHLQHQEHLKRMVAS